MVATRRGGGSRWGRPERSLPRRRSSFPNRRRHVEPTAAATPFAGRDRHHVRLVFSTTEAMSCSLSVGECRSCVCMTATGKLREGDVVPLPHGPCGAHQIRNETNDVVRVLDRLDESNPDVAEYPDTGKVGIITQAGDCS